MARVVRWLAGCSKFIVAAVHGAALGGGFKCALDCDARAAMAGTVLSLPEVTLSILLVAGGAWARREPWA